MTKTKYIIIVFAYNDMGQKCEVRAAGTVQTRYRVAGATEGTGGVFSQ